MISKSRVTEIISFDHLKWDGDHLRVYFPPHKSDKLGKYKDDPNRFYAIWSHPPDVLHMHWHLTCCFFPDIMIEEKIFPDDKQRTGFNQLFHDILMHNIDTHLQNGIGTHIIRKGAAAYCCAGEHPGLLIVSVSLRVV